MPLTLLQPTNVHNVHVRKLKKKRVLESVKPRLHKRIQPRSFTSSTWNSNILLNVSAAVAFSRQAPHFKSQKDRDGTAEAKKKIKREFHLPSVQRGSESRTAASSPERGRYRCSVQGVWTASVFTEQSVYSRRTAHSPECYYTPPSFDSTAMTQECHVLCSCAGSKCKRAVHWESMTKGSKILVYTTYSPFKVYF